MSKVTGYILCILGVIMVIGGGLGGMDSFAVGVFFGILMIIAGLSIIAKNERKNEQNSSKSAAEVKPEKRNGFVLAAAIITLFTSLSMASAEISQFMDYSGYAIVEALGGMMAIQGILTIVACVLFFLGWWNSDAGKTLVASILTCVAVVFTPLYLAFYALPIIFGFIGYKRLKNTPVSEKTRHTSRNYTEEKDNHSSTNEKRITYDVLDIVAEGEYVHEYSIAGVTFCNDDGSSRQDILQDIQSRGYCSSVEFLVEDFQSEISVAVFVDGEQIGHIKKTNLKYFMDHYDQMTGVSEVFVDDFESDDDIEIKYYCKISVTYNKDRL